MFDQNFASMVVAAIANSPFRSQPETPVQEETDFDRWERETIERLKRARAADPGRFERQKAEIEARAEERKKRLLADFHRERKQWIRDYPGRDNPYRWVEYDKNGKLLPISKSLHV